MQPLDHADVAAGVTRQARVRRGMNIFRAHAVAGFEARGRLRRPSVRAALRNPIHIRQRERAAR